MTKTQFTITEVARGTNKSPTTIRKAIKDKKLCFTLNDRGHKLIEFIEVERAFGAGSFDPKRLDAAKQQGSTVHGSGDQVLHSDLAILKQQLDMINNERDRERHQLKEQIADLQDSLKTALEGHKDAVKLLQHHKEEGIGGLQQLEQKLEERFANQAWQFEERIEKLQTSTRQEVYQELKTLPWWRAIIRLARS